MSKAIHKNMGRCEKCGTPFWEKLCYTCQIEQLQSKLEALEEKIIQCCSTCDSFITHTKAKTWSGAGKTDGHCPFTSEERKGTDHCEKWNIKALSAGKKLIIHVTLKSR